MWAPRGNSLLFGCLTQFFTPTRRSSLASSRLAPPPESAAPLGYFKTPASLGEVTSPPRLIPVGSSLLPKKGRSGRLPPIRPPYSSLSSSCESRVPSSCFVRIPSFLCLNRPVLSELRLPPSLKDRVPQLSVMSLILCRACPAMWR